MNRQILLLAAFITGCMNLMAQQKIFHTSSDAIRLLQDDFESTWKVNPELKPDILETTASSIAFISDKDSIVIDNLKDWESFDFVILTNKGDSAEVRVTRKAVNPFENPNPELLKIAPSGKLSKQQAIFDIDGLIYGLSQVHPDIFSVCKQEDLLRAVNKAKESLPDSVSLIQLYRVAAPIVSMIGDGHTSLEFPYDDFFTSELKRLPLFVNVLPDSSIICNSSLDSIIKRGDKILSINGKSADNMIDDMLPFVSGEKPHYKLSGVNSSFQALFNMLYPSDNYDIIYQPKESEEILSVSFPAITFDEIKKRCPRTSNGGNYDDYSYTIDRINNVAIMDFRHFYDAERMEHFADSMFRELSDRNINNLIIDIRNNGGGNSRVGDVLLRYISPEPYVQMDKALIRITPLTAKLMGSQESPMFTLWEADSTDYIQPRSKEDGHYNGNVYLLTSNQTFSSAASFAWAFKECKMGKVIGEETGGMNVSYGDILPYSLPISKLTTYIPFKRFWQLRADENDIHGTLPDINVPSSEALTKALEIILE